MFDRANTLLQTPLEYTSLDTPLQTVNSLFHDGGPYHIETSPLIRKANRWTGFFMIGTSVMKKFICAIYLKLQIYHVTLFEHTLAEH